MSKSLAKLVKSFDMCKSFGKKMFFFAVTEQRTRSEACAMGNSFLRTIAPRGKWKIEN